MALGILGAGLFCSVTAVIIGSLTFGLRGPYFAIGTLGVAIAAGAIIVMVWLVQPFYGISYSIRAFVIVTAAGLGNLPGVIAAGLGIGALEQYGAHIFGIGYQQAVAVLLLLLVLLYRLIQQRRNRQVLK